MPKPPTAPHLAELTLRPATADDVEEFFATTMRGFHEDYAPEHWGPGQAVFEPSRNFGYAVDGRWISTAGVYSRVMTVPGGAVPVAAVTFVTVQPSYRRRGVLTAMMQHQLADIVERGTEPVALLWASESLIYGRFGYGPAVSRYRVTGPTQSMGFRPDVHLGAGSVGEVEREVALPIITALRESWLGDRVGALNRNEAWWTVRWHDPEPWRHGASAYRYVLHYGASGQPDGYAAFRVKEGADHGFAEVQVTEVDAAGPDGYAGLWRFLLSLDLVRSFTADVPTDFPLRQLVADPRMIKAELMDATYARLIDVRTALEARTYAADLDVVIGVRDRTLPANDGAIRLQAGPDGAVTSRARRKPDLTLDVRDLGAIYLGNNTLGSLRSAGLVEERTGDTVAAVSAAFTTLRAPFCEDFF